MPVFSVLSSATSRCLGSASHFIANQAKSAPAACMEFASTIARQTRRPLLIAMFAGVMFCGVAKADQFAYYTASGSFSNGATLGGGVAIDLTTGAVVGSNLAGDGYTFINNAGNYEFVTATGPASGGSVPILGAGVGGGLVFGYNAAGSSASLP